MITKKDIIKSARHLFKRSKGIPDVRLMHPQRDWLLGLSIALVLFMITAGYAGLTFFIKTNEASLAPTVTDTVVTYNAELVLEVLESYRNRTTQFEALRRDTTNRGSVIETETVEEVAVEDSEEGEGSAGEDENSEEVTDDTEEIIDETIEETDVEDIS